MRIHKIKASILLYALFIMVVITIIIGSIILLSHINFLERKSYEVENDLRTNVDSGIALLLADSDVIDYGGTDSIFLFSQEFEENSFVTIRKNLWGFGDLLYCKASWRHFIKEKIVLAGNYYQNNESLALYLADRRNPLCFVGKAFISGNCKIPKAGLKRGYVEGRNFTGDNFMDGLKSESDSLLPLNEEKILRNSLEYVIDNLLDDSGIEIINYDEIENDGLTNSFYSPTIIVFEPENITLNSIISGNIVIVSESDIFIERGSKLEDVLIYAKNIFIESGFTGSLQCFAEDTLIVSQNCNLTYPSTIATIHLDEKENKSHLKLESGIQFSGTILQYGKKSKKYSKPEIIILKDALITGQIYATGSLELLSDVNGSVYTNSLVLSKPSARYINHISDIKINLTKLPMGFVGSSLFTESHPAKIIKWF